MPNWVNCELEVRGDNNLVDAFMEEQRAEYEEEYTNPKTKRRQTRISVRELDFGASVPEPKWTEQQHKEQLWYEWRIKNWGCKWQPCEVGSSSSDLFGGMKEGDYHFDTPWSYPAEWLLACGKKYPHLEFILEWEEEQGYTGIHQIQGGETVYEDSCDVPSLADNEDEDELYENFLEEVQDNRYRMRKGIIQ